MGTGAQPGFSYGTGYKTGLETEVPSPPARFKAGARGNSQKKTQK